MEASYLVGSFPCQFNFISVFDIPVWDEFWEQATFRHLCPFRNQGCSQHISTVPTPSNGGNPGIKDSSYIHCQVMVGTLESRIIVYPLSPHQVMVGTLESRIHRIHLYLSQQIGVRSSKTSQCGSANRPSVVPQGSPRVLVPF